MATVKAVCFDIGETLVDETRHWSVIAGEAGVPELTLFGVLGGVAARGEHHTRVFDILGIEPIAGPDYAAQDLYPDALPCLAELKARGYRLGLAGNQPARTEHFLRTLGVDVDLVASSASWGVEKPSPGFFERLAAELAPTRWRYAHRASPLLDASWNTCPRCTIEGHSFRADRSEHNPPSRTRGMPRSALARATFGHCSSWNIGMCEIPMIAPSGDCSLATV
jgi:hypothetical protein